MPKKLSLTGQRFGRLTVLGEVARRSCGHIKWLCECDCGGVSEVSGSSLLQNIAKSCGCLRVEKSVLNLVEYHKKDIFKGTAMHHIDNPKSRSNTISGKIGVTWYRRESKWVARLMIRGKSIFLGYYDNFSDAIKARKNAEEEYFQPIIDQYNAEAVSAG